MLMAYMLFNDLWENNQAKCILRWTYEFVNIWYELEYIYIYNQNNFYQRKKLNWNCNTRFYQVIDGRHIYNLTTSGKNKSKGTERFKDRGLLLMSYAVCFSLFEILPTYLLPNWTYNIQALSGVASVIFQFTFQDDERIEPPSLVSE